MRYAYPAVLETQPDGGLAVFFEGPPGATQGETEAEALREAEDLLLTAPSVCVDEGRPLPRPAQAGGRPVVVVGPLAAAKLALHEAMLDRGVGDVELANRLGSDEKAVRRLRDPLHRSHVGAVEAALRALGRRLVVEVLELALKRARRLAPAPAGRHVPRMATTTAAAAATTISILVNGEARGVPAPATVADLLASIGLDARKVAVERNLEIVPRSAYADTELVAGDALEVVHFIGGG